MRDWQAFVLVGSAQSSSYNSRMSGRVAIKVVSVEATMIRRTTIAIHCTDTGCGVGVAGCGGDWAIR